MIEPLQVATDGYLTAANVSKKLLILALAGYLSFSSPTPSVTGGGPDYYYPRKPQNTKIERNFRDERLRQDDEEVLAILSVIVRCL